MTVGVPEPSAPAPVKPPSTKKSLKEIRKRQLNFAQKLRTDNVDIATLRKNVRINGIHPQARAIIWQFLLDYLEPQLSRRQEVVSEKRKTYVYYCDSFYSERKKEDDSLISQINVDVPRTYCDDRELFQSPIIQGSLTRILFVWSKLHFEIGYFQGLSDLIAPFYQVS